MHIFSISLVFAIIFSAFPSFAQTGYGGMSNFGGSGAVAPANPNPYSGVQLPKAEEENKKVTDEIIFSYDNFSVTTLGSNRVTCLMKFHVENRSKHILSSVSVGLDWGEMKTSLNFNDIEPLSNKNVDYGLLGPGCYSMSGEPEITVNRCRMRPVEDPKASPDALPQSISQDECADMIRWRR